MNNFQGNYSHYDFRKMSHKHCEAPRQQHVTVQYPRVLLLQIRSKEKTKHSKSTVFCNQPRGPTFLDQTTCNSPLK